MTRYPNAYSTPSHRNHIKAVEDNLNSAKLAQREVQNQQKSECRNPHLKGYGFFCSSVSDGSNQQQSSPL